MMDDYARKLELSGKLTPEDRVLKHSFSRDFFKLKRLELNLEFFVVSKDPINKMLLIEKHYFKD